MTSVQHSEIPDGLRAWQSVVVRLWSASDDAFAALTLTWVPEGIAGAPWIARLQYGDDGGDGWAQEIRVSKAPTIQQALFRLWQRTEPQRASFKADPQYPSLPASFAEDAWLTSDELELMERLSTLLLSRQPIALQLGYRPELGLSSVWVAVLHDPTKVPPEGVTLAAQAAHLAEVCAQLIQAANTEVNVEDTRS
jgi:hypothetical protein